MANFVDTVNKNTFFRDNDLHFFLKTDKIPYASNYFPHAHDHFELYCFLSGDAEFIIEGNHYNLLPGSILLMRPAEVHQFHPLSEREYSRFVFEFPGNIVASFDTEKKLLSPFLDRPLGHFNLYKSREFNKILPIDLFYRAAEVESNAAIYKLKLLSCLFMILTSVLSVFESSSRHTEPLLLSPIEQITNYIDSNIMENLSVMELSQKFFISKSSLERNFKSHTRMSVKEYITVKRLMLARELIRNGQPPTIAYLHCGYNDYSTFFRAYRKLFNISPSEKLAERGD